MVLTLHRGRQTGMTPRLSGPRQSTRRTHTQTVGRFWTSLILGDVLVENPHVEVLPSFPPWSPPVQFFWARSFDLNDVVASSGSVGRHEVCKRADEFA